MLSTTFSLTFFTFSVIFSMNLNYFMNFQIPMFSLQELFSISILLDSKSTSFSSLVCFITSMVFLYSIFYLSSQLNSRFIYLIFLFSSSMLMLILSSNLPMVMLGWDGLGVVSFALVFFYQNEISVKSAIITVLINRMGDAALVIFIGSWIFMEKNLFSIPFLFSTDNSKIFIFLVFAAFTKSAQYPFSSWLPAAMAAPTPISSLVHSSTLVAAGVYLMIRFNILMYLNLTFMAILSLLTMLLGGMLALSEYDFKKIIAFSTLSQLGMLMFSLFWGNEDVSFFHLISHAIFKSFLFLLSGVFLSLNFGAQDSRIISSNFNLFLFFIMMFFCILNLSGFPISLGFISKDLILESNLIQNFNFLFILFIISCSITVSYSMKMFLLISQKMKLMDFTSSTILMNKKMIFIPGLFLMMVFFGVTLEENNVWDNIYSLSMNSKIIDLVILTSSFFLKNLNFKFFESYLWVTFFIQILSDSFNKISLYMNLKSFYWINQLIIFNGELLKNNYSIFSYNYNFSNWLIFIFIFILFFFFS